MHPARRRLTVLSAAVATAIAAVLAVLLPISSASAASGPAARNGVGAHHPVMIFTVGVPHSVSAVQSRGEAASQPRFAVGACVAAEDAGSDLADAGADGDDIDPGCDDSFTPATKVLLASGAAIPISQLKPGDKVLATNVKTAKTQAETVRAVILEHDIDLYDLTVKVHGRTAVIQTTARHRFWDQTTRAWTYADALPAGDLLRTPGHATVSVVSGQAPADTVGWMWDLTIAHDHDFYINAATAPSSSTTARW